MSGANDSLASTPTDFPFKDFAPTLAQCIFIVFAGYLAARSQLLSASDTRGINLFAIYFAMPAIICVSLAEADLRDLHWQLLVGIVLGKAIIFGVVAGCALLLNTKPNFGMAGMLAMFCVQCNDLPVGNPLMSTLYRHHRKNLLKYLFFIPALTLIFFGPLSYVMMEVRSDKHPLSQALADRRRLQRNRSKDSLYSQVSCRIRTILRSTTTRNLLLSLLKSPVIIATVLGVLMNIIFESHVPPVLYHPINVVAAMIPGLALSTLGFSLLGKERYLISSGVVLAAVLISVKMVFTPLILHSVVKLLAGNSSSDLPDFALLYGVISPATVIFQSAEVYHLPIAGMSIALILSSFFCFPLSYVIARITIIPLQDLNHYIPSLVNLLLYLAIFTILGSLSTCTTLIWSKQWKKSPCCHVMNLAFSQVMTACGVILWKVSDVSRRWTLYGEVVFCIGGEISLYVWTATLAIVLFLQQNYPEVLKSSFVLIISSAYGFSALSTVILCAMIFKKDLKDVLLFGQPKYDFQYMQLESCTAILIMSMTVVATCLTLYMRRKHYPVMRTSTLSFGKEKSQNDNAVYSIDIAESEISTTEKRQSGISTASTATLCPSDDEICCYYDEVLKTADSQKTLVFGHRWTSRLICLLTFLLIIMVFRLFANIFKLFDIKDSAVLVPLEYLQATTFVSQGVWTFLTFGIDARTAVFSLVKRWRKMMHGTEEFKITISCIDDEEDIRMACKQFKQFFYKHCFASLAKERYWKKYHYRNSFWGHQMVDWLIQTGITKDRSEAEEYGEKLLLGKVISHVRNAHQFYDAPYIYYFVENH